MTIETFTFDLPSLAYIASLDEKNMIGPGNDSDVYRFENSVFKVYRNYKNEFETPSRLVFYQSVTNKAAEIVEKEGLTLDFPFSKRSYPVKVNPYSDLFYQKDIGRWVGTAPYVDGKTVREIKHLVDVKEFEIALSTFSWRLADRLKISGIKVVPINTRYVDRLNDPYFCITDLCSEIEELGKFNMVEELVIGV